LSSTSAGEQPDFSYPIQDAFKNKYLVPYRFATGITEIIAEGADVDDVTMTQQGLSGGTNEDTNRKMMGSLIA